MRKSESDVGGDRLDVGHAIIEPIGDALIAALAADHEGVAVPEALRQAANGGGRLSSWKPPWWILHRARVYVAAAGDDIGWSVPSDELFQWWLDEERAISLMLYGRKAVGDNEFPLADWRPAARRYPGADRVRAELAGHAEGSVLLDSRQGRLEHPPGLPAAWS